MLMREIHTVSPLDLLKNPMILIAVVGLGFVFGMPYLMDSSTFTFSPAWLLPPRMALMTDVLVRCSGSRDEEGV